MDAATARRLSASNARNNERAVSLFREKIDTAIHDIVTSDNPKYVYVYDIPVHDATIDGSFDVHQVHDTLLFNLKQQGYGVVSSQEVYKKRLIITWVQRP